jgi:hypothetical protein
MATKKSEFEKMGCPIGQLFEEFQKLGIKDSPFFQHLDRSRLELLKAVKSVVDAKIDKIEKKEKGRTKKRATKIKVEQA